MNIITIYQIKEMSVIECIPRRDIVFCSFEEILEIVPDFIKDNKWEKFYDVVYNYVSDSEEDVDVLLEDIFTKFNIDHPKDFKGHSLSISDVVKVNNIPYFCDRFGWKRI